MDDLRQRKIRRFFDAADADGDGVITLPEFTHIFGATAGASEAVCAATFTQLDLDTSGGLSRAEYLKAVTAYFYGVDPTSPAKQPVRQALNTSGRRSEPSR